MDDQAGLYMQRAENELVSAQILFEISNKQDLQDAFHLERQFTFYNGTITHSYYSIFFAAKAMLAKEGITTSAPEVHKKTLDAFEKHLVNTGKLDMELLQIYRKMVVRAEVLLGIFSKEKGKRGDYTYQKLPQANREPAKESYDNASFFFRHINKVIRK
jgi:uncharacterized protein (UPF0332 family)